VAALLVASGLHLLLKTSAIPDKSLPEKPGKTLGIPTQKLSQIVGWYMEKIWKKMENDGHSYVFTCLDPSFLPEECLITTRWDLQIDLFDTNPKRRQRLEDVICLSSNQQWQSNNHPDGRSFMKSTEAIYKF